MKRSSRNTSGYIGVSLDKRRNKWRARIYRDNKDIMIGYFSTKEEAYEAKMQYIKDNNIEYSEEAFCREKYLVQYIDKNRDKISDQQKRYRKENLEKIKIAYKEYYDKNKDRLLKDKQVKNQDYKREAIDAYGSVCQCCSEYRLQFLSIDIIAPGGRELHKKIGYGPAFYRWLRKQDYPKDNYQCLCMNCNFAKGMFGVCPHIIERENINVTTE